MKVALVHDWLVTYRGGEKVLSAIAEMFPDAPIYTLFYDKTSMPKFIRQREIIVPTYLNRIRALRKQLLPILPACIESLSISGYDLIISSSSCVAKGILPEPGTKHICYLHSPMRYIWDQREHYFKTIRKIPGLSLCANILAKRLREWDTVSSTRVDRFIVNSSFVASRVQRYYRREAVVVPPPVELERFSSASDQHGLNKSYFLVAGALVPYKGFDLAIRACEKAKQRLVVAGSGPEEKFLRKIAGKFTAFVRSPSDEKFADLLRQAKALIFPGVEDFGITAIEAMASGTPVIALNKGGALDFIKETTGQFFKEPSIEALTEVLGNFQRSRFHTQELRIFAENFTKEKFQQKIKQEIGKVVLD